MRRLLLLACLLCACRDTRTAVARRPLASPPGAIDLDPAEDVVSVRLVAERAGTEPLRYTYNQISPGPTIRAKVGDTLKVELENRLATDTSLHWHGLHVPWEMDGIAWMQSPVPPGGSFTYQFTLGHAGTFWYHPHFDTDHQVDAGLYGALVVEARTDPIAADDLVLIFDTTAEVKDGTLGAAGHARLDTRWNVNGELLPTYTARGGTVVRARMINASNSGYLALSWPDLRVIGGDQGLLPALSQPARVLLAPGDRAEVEWLIGQQDFDVVALPYTLNGGDTLGMPAPIVHVDVSTPAPAPSGLAWPFAGGTVTADPGYTDIVYAFAGSDRTRQWLINGQRYPNVTIEEAPLGRDSIIEVRNLSATEHPFHLHGLSFEVLSVNGAPPPYRMFEDTFNVRIRERVRLLLHADNPGDWMAHCHILPHQEDGMMTVLRVH